MRDASDVSTPQKVKRIGIILADVGKVNEPVLKFLVLHMNTLQKTFEFEFLSANLQDSFIKMLSPYASVDREKMRQEVNSFLGRFLHEVQAEIREYNIRDTSIPKDRFILITLSRFVGNYYNLRERNLSILALGNWKRSMAPPSIVEFILTFVLREAITSVSPTLRDSVHLGTKGCLCDFSAFLDDTKLKVLNGFVCSYCRAALQTEGFATLADELVHVLGKSWLGTSTDPSTPAGIAANLGYDLFITKGLKASRWEIMLTLLQQEGVKQFISIVGAVLQFILIALLILWLGLKR